MFPSKINFKEMKVNKKNKEVFYSIVLVVIPVFVLLILAFWMKNKSIENTVQVAAVVETIPEEKPELNLNLSASGVYVERLNTGEIIYKKNENTPLPLASISKVMTALVAYDILTKNENISNSNLIISEQDLLTEGEYNLNLGEGFSLQDLIDLTLIKSANDGAAALASASAKYSGTSKSSFIQEMNNYADKIGMKNTFFKNETGLDISINEASSAGTASDVAKLFKYVLKNHPDIFEATKKTSTSVTSSFGLVHRFDNTNDIVNELDNLLASKTGYTDLAGGNLGVIVDMGLNDPYIIIVLGSTKEKRFSDVLEIINQIKNIN